MPVSLWALVAATALQFAATPAMLLPRRALPSGDGAALPCRFSPELSSTTMTFREEGSVCVPTHPSNSRAIVDYPMTVSVFTQTRFQSHAHG